MLKACMWSSYFVDFPIEKAVDAFLDCGFFEAELSSEHGEILLSKGDPEKTGRALKRYADDSGFSFPQGHLALNANICLEDPAPVIEELKNWLELFDAVGIRSAVLHSGQSHAGASDDEMLEKRCESLSKLTDHIKGSALQICLENLIKTTQSSASLLKIIDCAGSDRLGICLDTGHLNISKAETQYEFIKNAGARLKALHIADNEGEWDQHLMPYGRGTADWPGVMRGLREIGYNRAFNFEIPGERRAPLAILKEKLIYINKMAAYMKGDHENAEI